MQSRGKSGIVLQWPTVRMPAEYFQVNPARKMPITNAAGRASVPLPQYERESAGDVEIEFTSWPRIEPGIYKAYSRKAAIYRDKRFKRWVCLVRFDILDDHLQKIESLAWFLNLGSGEKPHAGSASNYYTAWTAANGGRRPLRKDRMSPTIFSRRMATVSVADTTKNHRRQDVDEGACYSVVSEVKSWDSGSSNQSINQSTKPTGKGLPGEVVTKNQWQERAVSVTSNQRLEELENQKRELLKKYGLPAAGQGSDPSQFNPTAGEPASLPQSQVNTE